MRIGVDDCTDERSVLRIICDQPYAIVDRRGNILFEGQARQALLCSIREAEAGRRVWYFILKTFAPEEKNAAEAMAREVRSRIKRSVTVGRDPRVDVTPPAIGDLSAPEPRLAVYLGPYFSRAAAGVDEARAYGASSETKFYRSYLVANPGTIEMRDATGSVVAKSTDGYLGMKPMAENSLVYGRRLRSDYRTWADGQRWNTDENRAYRGWMEVWANPEGRLSAVNRVFLEHYLYGVVAPEIGTSVPFEMQKTQAVIARSEAIAKLRMHRYAGWHYDHCDTQMSQVYKGVYSEEPATNAAVDATWGQVVVYENEIADAVYCMSCGGLTANNEDVWGGKPKGYLRSVLDGPGNGPAPKLDDWRKVENWLKQRPMLYCHPEQEGFPAYSRKSNFRWSGAYNADGLARRMREVYGDVGRVTNVRVVERTPSGRVRELAFDTTGRGAVHFRGEMPVRRALRLRSTFFVLDREFDGEGNITWCRIQGAGWGHAVGLCQSGATVMAAKGFHYLDILQHYFKGIEVYRIYR
ncbi:MAG: SpoIID/LytB domain-containing protein [Candidatus Sumerlaeota bacterium]